jgi:hypothetical protein
MAMRKRLSWGRWAAVCAGTTALVLSGLPAYAAAEEEEGYGNNLAVPVVWAEAADAGVRPVLRGTGPQTEDLTLDPAAHVQLNGDELFLQKTANTWQAENADAAALSGLAMTEAGKVDVSTVDWGDNLEAMDWRTGMQVRVETKLLQDVSGLTDAADATTGMTGYVMKKVSGQGQDESWGVVGLEDSGAWHAQAAQATEAVLYTSKGCLSIERIDQANTLTWDPDTHMWTDAGTVKCLGEVTDGPGGYNAEVTVSGGMTYGFVWSTKSISAGLYRLTFSLKPDSGAAITNNTTVLQPVEEEGSAALAAEEEEGGKPGGNTAVLDPANNLTYIDVGISYNDSKPTRPLDLQAVPDVGSVALSWKTPASAGEGPITGYSVTGKRVDGSATLPETIVPADQALAATYLGLTGDEPYEFSVAAVTPSGTGDTATVVATPKSAPKPGEPVVVPAEPGGDVKQVRRNQRSLKLKIRVRAQERIKVRAFGEVYAVQAGEKVRTRTQVTLWFNPVGKNKPALVIKRIRTNAKGEFTTRFQVQRAGSVFATVAQNETMLAARSKVYTVRLAA